MQEFWFCEACKSMNRGNADHCYRCHAPKDSSTMATVVRRQPGVVLTPGLDDEHRAVAWTLMFRQTYVSAWKLGYVAATLLLLVIAVGAVAAAIEIALMVSRGSPTPVAPADARSPIFLVTLLAMGLIGLCAAVAHSVFLGLTSMDAPALGSGSPQFDPVRAGLWWIESWLWAIRAGLAFVVPPLLCFYAMSIGGVILGLVPGLVWVVCAFWLLGDPITSLGKPARLLKDLWERLAVPGSSDARIVTLWSAAWGVARGVDYAIAALTYIAIMALAIASFVSSRSGVSIGGSSNANVTLMVILLVDLVVLVQWIADGIALYLLAQITIELSQRQRTREGWVLAGSSSALARANLPIAPQATVMPAAPTPLPAAPTPLESIAEPDGSTSVDAAVDRPVIRPSATSIGRYGAPRDGDVPRDGEALGDDGGGALRPDEPEAGGLGQADAPLPEDLGWGEGI